MKTHVLTGVFGAALAAMILLFLPDFPLVRSWWSVPILGLAAGLASALGEVISKPKDSNKFDKKQ